MKKNQNIIIGIVVFIVAFIAIVVIVLQNQNAKPLMFQDTALVEQYTKNNAQFSVKVYQYNEKQFRDIMAKAQKWNDVQKTDENYKHFMYSVLREFVEYAGGDPKLYNDFAVNKYDLQFIAKREHGKYRYVDLSKENHNPENIMDFTKYQNDSEFSFDLLNPEYRYVYCITKIIKEK